MIAQVRTGRCWAVSRSSRCGGWGAIVWIWASPAASLPDPDGVSAAVDVDGVEPVPQWIGDAAAAARFGSPVAIRAALLPEQVGEFDAAFDAALTAARQTLRLDQLRDVLQVWRRVALLTEEDPDRYRQMLVSAAEVVRTRRPRPGSVPWTELRAELGI